MPAWIKRLMLPKLSELCGEIKESSMRVDWLGKRIRGVEKVLESSSNGMIARFEAVHARPDSIGRRSP